MFHIPENYRDDTNKPSCNNFSSQERIILHCDLNNFYASVECLHRPDLKGLPVAVGGSEKKRHGIILAKNRLAKSFGVKTAEPIRMAKEKCPGLVILPPNMPDYISYSRLVRQIYEKYTDRIEPFGIDECWLDITGSTLLLGSGEKIADDIRKRVKNDLGLTISVGVSWNKVFAKLGSDIAGPDSIAVISKENYRDIIWSLPVENLLFVGRKTANKLRKIGINTIGKLAVLRKEFLEERFGKWGLTLWVYSNGRDTDPVENTSETCSAKGIGNSMTLPADLHTYQDAKVVLMELSETVSTRLRKENLRGRTVCISMKNTDFEHTERQQSLSGPVCSGKDLLDASLFLLQKNWHPGKSKPLRALGIRVTNLTDRDYPTQISLFDDESSCSKYEKLDRAIDHIRERFGEDSVVKALLLKEDKDN